MYLMCIEYELLSNKPEMVPFSELHLAHKAIFQRLSSIDPILAKSVHDQQVGKGITITVINHPGDNPVLRLTFIGNSGLELAILLINTFLENPKIVIGTHHFQMKISSQTTPSIKSGVVTGWDLVNAPAGRSLHFHFQTPTSITKKDRFGRRYSQLLPDPLDIFASLERRWYSCEGPDLPIYLNQGLKEGDCCISFLNISTVEFKVDQRIQIGILGKVRYSVMAKDNKFVSTLSILSRFARYASVGYQTARGLGSVSTSVRP